MSNSAKSSINNGLAWIDEQLRIIADRSGDKLTREGLANAGGFDSSIFSNIKSGRQNPGVKFFDNVATGFQELGAKHINAAIVAAQFGLGGNIEEIVEDDIARLIGHRLSKIKDPKIRQGIIKTIDNLLDLAARINGG